MATVQIDSGIVELHIGLGDKAGTLVCALCGCKHPYLCPRVEAVSFDLHGRITGLQLRAVNQVQYGAEPVSGFGYNRAITPIDRPTSGGLTI